MARQTREVSWSSYYRLARAEMEFRYGLRRISVDEYKTAFALGLSLSAACKSIADARRIGSRFR